MGADQRHLAGGIEVMPKVKGESMLPEEVIQQALAFVERMLRKPGVVVTTHVSVKRVTKPDDMWERYEPGEGRMLKV